ncbi:hypothetical protein KI387_019356, partial [Taxus chinensis]
DEVVIRRKDNNRLTLEEIQILELADIPEGTMHNESVVETRYEQSGGYQHGIPTIDWYVAEKSSIAERAAQ